MTSLSLYCKSYRTDLKRVIRLAESVQRFNKDRLPFYISVPAVDLPLFKEHLSDFKVELLTDEQILEASPRIEINQVVNVPGNVLQQIVKSEFWRLNLSDAYLCLDSDGAFIRPFGRMDLVDQNGVPYTTIHEAHELMDLALSQNKPRIVEAFFAESAKVKALFNRTGRDYGFGPAPFLWHRLVWESLDNQFLKPRGMSFHDAILYAPLESRWYGEALLAFKAIDLIPAEALFKVYHYAWQFDRDRRLGITFEKHLTSYIGVIYQSAWDREMDWPNEGGTMSSRLNRRWKRLWGRL